MISTGTALKGNKIVDKGVAFRLNSVVGTTEKYSSDNKFYFKAPLIQPGRLRLFYEVPPFHSEGTISLIISHRVYFAPPPLSFFHRALVLNK